jgi:NitT/TauT family transport system permease protein
MSLLRTPIHLRKTFSLPDFAVLAGVGALIYAVAHGARQAGAEYQQTVDISLSPAALPGYALLTLMRGFVAYGISLAFTIIYGRVAAYHPRAETVMVPMLDILQSIPVLGFLPGLVLAMVALFPRTNLGLELACILMIFTGQVWNMTFSFYHSLQAIPSDLREAGKIYRLSWWQRFTQLELPYSAIGLVWNSMMSMAGGWFFLTVTEAFVLGDNDFRLPGLGSYVSVAIQRGDWAAMIYGMIAMIVMIVAMDWLVWRPLVAWSQKFKFEETEASEAPQSAVLDFFRRSHLLSWTRNILSRRQRVGQAPRLSIAAEKAEASWKLARFSPQPVVATADGGSASIHVGEKVISAHSQSRPAAARIWSRLSIASGWLVTAMFVVGVAWGGWKLLALIQQLSLDEWARLLGLTALTFGRVAVAVAIGTLVMIPIGVAIGMNPKLSRRFQPVIQVVASFPAPMLFPIVLLALNQCGVSIEIAAIALMLLGTQWYILFNVIAGAMAIPHDLREAAQIYRLTRWEKWRRLILPGIFPSLVTGWVTAMGGAWNASIVAESVHFGHEASTATGLGAEISKATEAGNFPLLAASVFIMCLTVVGFNRLVWKRLYHLAETKFSLNK